MRIDLNLTVFAPGSCGPERRARRQIVQPGVGLVKNLFEEEAACRSRVLAFRAVAGQQDAAEFVRAHASASHEHQGADHAAHHFVEEPRAEEIHADERAERDDLAAEDRPHGIVDLAAFDRERGEIVFPLDVLDRLAQGVDLRHVLHVPRIAPAERVDVAGIDHVDVGLGERVEPRVEAVLHDLGGADADVVKKSLKDVAGEANSIIKDLTTSLNGLEIDDLIKLKNLDGSNFMGSFEDLMSFNKSVLKGKYFNQSVA